MSGHRKNSKRACSALKTVLGKIRNRVQTYCAVYKTHAMATQHGGAGHPICRDINLHVEDAETTGLESTHESMALEGSEAEGYPDELVPSNQAKLTALTREINDLHL